MTPEDETLWALRAQCGDREALELLLRTKLDLEAGQVEVRDALASALGTARMPAPGHA